MSEILLSAVRMKKSLTTWLVNLENFSIASLASFYSITQKNNHNSFKRVNIWITKNFNCSARISLSTLIWKWMKCNFFFGKFDAWRPSWTGPKLNCSPDFMGPFKVSPKGFFEPGRPYKLPFWVYWFDVVNINGIVYLTNYHISWFLTNNSMLFQTVRYWFEQY